MFCRRRFMQGCGRAAKRCSRTSCFRQCDTNSAGISSQNMTGEQKLSPAGPCILVIFGASGDLTKRLLVPSLYHLKRAGLLPEAFAIAGIARTNETSEAFRDTLRESFQQIAAEPLDASAWDWLASRIHYLPGDLDNPQTYERLSALLREIDSTSGTAGNYLFY